ENISEGKNVTAASRHSASSDAEPSAHTAWLPQRRVATVFSRTSAAGSGTRAWGTARASSPGSGNAIKASTAASAASWAGGASSAASGSSGSTNGPKSSSPTEAGSPSA